MNKKLRVALFLFFFLILIIAGGFFGFREYKIHKAGLPDYYKDLVRQCGLLGFFVNKNCCFDTDIDILGWSATQGQKICPEGQSYEKTDCYDSIELCTSPMVISEFLDLYERCVDHWKKENERPSMYKDEDSCVRDTINLNCSQLEERVKKEKAMYRGSPGNAGMDPYLWDLYTYETCCEKGIKEKSISMCKKHIETKEGRGLIRKYTEAD